MIATRVIVAGRVQGVGYRAWAAREARARGLKGWVRNRADGSVEAVFAGPDEGVGAMIEACRRGPLAARVDRLTTFSAGLEPWAGFEVRPTE